MGIAYFLEVLKKYGINAEEDGYEALPQERVFADWRIAHRKADGADGYNMFWNVTYEVRICYREGRTETDKIKEKLIEGELRGLEGLESDYGYDPKDKFDITVYQFNDTVDF